MSDQGRLLLVLGAAVIAALILARVAVAVRNRKRSGKKVIAATMVARRSVPRDDKEQITETVVVYRGATPPLPEDGVAKGKSGYLALTRDHLVFVPYRADQALVLDRARLSDPTSRARKVWKKRRATITLGYAPAAGEGKEPAPDGEPVRVAFDVKGPYRWMHQFGYRAGFEGSELTGGQFGPSAGF